MRSVAAALSVLLITTLAIPAPASSPFVAHEWGTFTTFQGSDGVDLDGLHHESEALPGFVYSLTEDGVLPESLLAPLPPRPSRPIEVRVIQEPVAPPTARSASAPPAQAVTPAPTATAQPTPAPTPRPRPCGKGIPCETLVRHVTTKMETPVIYFYTERERRVRVHVDFAHGVLSQFYPFARLTGLQYAADGALDMAALERTRLEWDVSLIPFGRPAPAFPVVHADDPWEYARDVRAASVVVSGEEHLNGATGRPEAERYLFYRGLGRLELPLRVDAHGNGRVTVRNGGAHAAPAAFAVEMTPRGGRFVELGALPAGGSRSADLSSKQMLPPDALISALSDRVQAALVAEGLYADEARAMVRTWSKTWFGSEGTRVLYLVPRSLTDEVLPLNIEPRPDELVRVLVGRLEFLTPEVKAETELALRNGDQDRLARFDRFLEPVLRDVAKTSRDATARETALRLLGE